MPMPYTVQVQYAPYSQPGSSEVEHPLSSFTSIHYILKNMFAWPRLQFQIALPPVPINLIIVITSALHLPGPTVTSVTLSCSLIIASYSKFSRFIQHAVLRLYISPTCTGYLNSDLRLALQIASWFTAVKQVRHIIYNLDMPELRFAPVVRCLLGLYSSLLPRLAPFQQAKYLLFSVSALHYLVTPNTQTLFASLPITDVCLHFCSSCLRVRLLLLISNRG